MSAQTGMPLMGATAKQGAPESSGATDFHAHWWSRGLLDAISDLRGDPGLRDRWLAPPVITDAPDVFDLKARVVLMDEAKIAVQVLSGSNVGHGDPSVA